MEPAIAVGDPPASLAGSKRPEIQSIEPNLPVPAIDAMTETIGTSLYAARMAPRTISRRLSALR